MVINAVITNTNNANYNVNATAKCIDFGNNFQNVSYTSFGIMIITVHHARRFSFPD